MTDANKNSLPAGEAGEEEVAAFNEAIGNDADPEEAPEDAVFSGDPYTMSLHEKLLEVRKTVSYLQKKTQGQQYNYVSSSQVLSAVREGLDNYGILLQPSVVDKTVSIKEDVQKPDNRWEKRTQRTYFTELFMVMKWVNAYNPTEEIECKWYAQGVDIAGEKGVGKALTYGEKYFMLKYFNIATDKDDPDAHQAKNKPPTISAQQALKLKEEIDKRAINVTKLLTYAAGNSGMNYKNIAEITQGDIDFVMKAVHQFPVKPKPQDPAGAPDLT